MRRDMLEALIEGLPVSMVKTFAKCLARTMPLHIEPGWRFGYMENPSPIMKARYAIWRYFYRRGAAEPMVMKWHAGTRTKVYLGNDCSRCLYVSGCIEPNEMAFFDSCLAPGMVVLDIGANMGLYTLIASGRVGKTGRVIAIEPSQREFGRLQANVQLNRLTNVTLLQYALSDREGEAILHISGEDHEGLNTLGDFIYEGVHLVGEECVRMRRVDDLLSEQKVARVDVVKMDVEGAEWHVLKGAERLFRESRPLLLLELVDKSLRAQKRSVTEVLSILKGYGYVIYSFDDKSGTPVPLSQASALSENIVAVHPSKTYSQLSAGK